MQSINMFSRFARQVVQSILAMAIAASFGVAACAAEADKPIWQRVTPPKPSLPRFLTKPIKVDAELPPAEAAKACIGTAKELFDRGYDHEATLLFERARQLDPKHAEVSRYLGILYDRQNDPVRANSEYERALKVAPKDADLLNDIGYFHYRRGKFSDAEKWFRDALTQNPKLDRAKVNLGMTLGQQGRFKEAYDVFASAVGPAAAHSNMGVLLAKQKRYPEAVTAFQTALSLEPGLPQAEACLASLNRRSGPSQPAVAHAP